MANDDSEQPQFPVDSKVLLQGLQKAPELNGQKGVVRGYNQTSGRFAVFIHSEKKSVNVKPGNLSYQPRSVDSLSVKELKIVLQQQQQQQEQQNGNGSKASFSGVDKSELQNQVKELTNDGDPQEIAQVLARHHAATLEAEAKQERSKRNNSTATSTTSSSTTPTVDPTQAADQLANMSPDQLRQQAAHMRSLDPASIRRMYPQLAGMSDAQIQQAAAQMELMANNPALLQRATQQMKDMTPEQLQQQMQMEQQQQQQQRMNGTSSATNPTTAPNNTNDLQQAADAMQNMTPEQMKQQAQMLKTMDPNLIRQSNPQMAHMTDDQIKMAATQFEMMADNPAMFQMAMDQMKNMTPQERDQVMRNGGAPAPPGSGSTATGGAAGPGGQQPDPAQMLANMDKAQLKQMLKHVKDNPEMIQQFASMTGSSPEQTQQMLETFATMDDAKLDMALTAMTTLQKAKGAWDKGDALVGGHLMKLVVLGGLLFVGAVLYYFFGTSSAAAAAASVVDPASAASVPPPKVPVVEDEFQDL